MPESAPVAPQPLTIHTALNEATALLSATSDSPRIDATALLSDCIGLDHAALIIHRERALDPIQRSRFQSACARRAQGEPVAYILGHRAFWTLDLEVNRHTLIPRPDTETLVEQALARLPEGAPYHVLDLGTGSGAIAIAIASERPECDVIATDISEDTLRVARRNAERANATVTFACGSWFEGLNALPTPAHSGHPFDLIVSNPPYIAEGDAHLDSGDLQAEPRRALVSGPDGLSDIRIIIQQTLAWLRPGGWLLLEHGFDQADAVASQLSTHGFDAVMTEHDLGGNPRVTGGQKPP